MKRGYDIGGRYSADPIGSDAPRGKDRSQRKSGRDGPSWTPTESRRRDTLLRQFLQRDGSQGNTDAYLASPVWCPGCDGRRLREQGKSLCARCSVGVAA